MKRLSDYPCAATPKDAAKLTHEQQRRLAPQIPDWKIELNGAVARLCRVYKVDNFVRLLALVIKLRRLLIMLITILHFRSSGVR